MKYLVPGLLVIILILAVGAGAFYLGKSTLNTQTIAPTPTISQNSSANGTPVLTPTPSVMQTTQVTSGGLLVFAKYSLDLPAGWLSQKETTQYSDMVTLSKNSYKITINQAAGGGGGCVYPGQPPQEMAQSFSSFVEIMDSNGFVFRRGANGTPGGFTICQKNATDGSFGFPTNFGNITITSPVPPSDTMMTEVDSILASLKKI